MNLPDKAKEALSRVASNDTDFEVYIGQFANITFTTQSKFLKKHNGNIPRDIGIIRDGLILHLLARVVRLENEIAEIKKGRDNA